jgi:hypothetical protein
MGTRRFINAFTSAYQLYLSWTSSIQFITPHPTSLRTILILSPHLHLGLPGGLFSSGFSTKTLYTLVVFPVHATCPTHLILLDLITRTILCEQYRSLSSSLCIIKQKFVYFYGISDHILGKLCTCISSDFAARPLRKRLPTTPKRLYTFTNRHVMSQKRWILTPTPLRTYNLENIFFFVDWFQGEDWL